MAGLRKEVWLNVILEQYDEEVTFLDNTTDLSAFVENDKINLAEAGIDPDVLINNTTYPVAVNERTDTPYALDLDYYDTENTLLRNAEAIELAYNKMQSITRRHAQALKNKQAERSTFNFAPTSDAAFTPVLPTTGATNGAGEKLITEDDIANLAAAFDMMNAPDGNRQLVLHTRHWNELVRTSQTLKEQRYRSKEGVMNRVAFELFGFQIHKYKNNPLYIKATGVKAAYGTTYVPATHGITSVAFVGQEAYKAVGTIDMFDDLKNPRERGDIIGFQQRFLAGMMRNKYFGAIRSVDV
ncbi:MAG: hypothetical protein COZ18_14960 [Flexibacter sp. CG_4_10_14_3_um_filter_32_15]|nr:MAG: hypothetical protein COZ18_14960 [Flexibacter sp. CG_4_10_14_3_um_filter_32_15]